LTITITLGIIVLVLIAALIYTLYNFNSKLKKVAEFETMVGGIPTSVLKCIQGSINPRKGKIGELVALLEVKSEYDTIIPLGQPIDMVGISEDSVDFIEIKTGGAQLTDTEKHIRDLVNEGKVRFRIMRYDIEADERGLQIESK
jgi:hypothetical protein